ncbi:MAG: hypothetical protein KKD39_01065, partial [Candidatus Altiarchaeota archaeon]|nr:hypothetical protein [Candidatus Altiarchaeota archaeon]
LTIGNYFKTRLDQLGAETKKAEIEVKDEDGNTAAKAYFERLEETGEWDLMGREDFDGQLTTYGELTLDHENELKLLDGELTEKFGSDIAFQNIRDGKQAYAEIKDSDGITKLVIAPAHDGGYNYYDSYGAYINAKIKDYANYKEYTLTDNYLVNYKEFREYDYETLLELELTRSDRINLILDFTDITYDQIHELNITATAIATISHYILLNGINNKNANGPPEYMAGFTQQLAIASPSMIDSTVIALYKDSKGFINDSGTWIKDAYLGSDAVTDEIIAGIDNKFGYSLPSDIVGLAYSGGGDPLLQALNKRHDIDMKSVVLVGTPLREYRTISNPNIENVIMVQGDRDIIGKVFHPFEYNPVPINEYHIFLKDIDHVSYSYDPNYPNPNPMAVKAARFVAEMMRLSNDSAKLKSFLGNTAGITFDNGTKMYTVDLTAVRYNP